MKNVFASNKSTIIGAPKDLSLKKIIFTMILSGFILAVSTRFFIIYTGILSPGFSGFGQGVSYLTTELIVKNNPNAIQDINGFNNILFNLVYLVMNIPIFIFIVKKFNYKYLWVSSIGYFSSIAFNIMFVSVPGLKDFSFLPGFDINEADIGMRYLISSISSILGGILFGIALALPYKIGYSFTGLDPIVRYYSRERGYDVSKLNLIFSIVNTFIWYIILSGVRGDFNSWNEFVYSNFGVLVLSSLVHLFVIYVMFNWLKPSRKVMLDINTSKGMEISDYLKEVKFHRGHTIVDIKGGMGKKRFLVKIIIYQDEINDLLKLVYEKDENAFINSSNLLNIYGNFDKRIIPIKLQEKSREEVKRKSKLKLMKPKFSPTKSLNKLKIKKKK